MTQSQKEFEAWALMLGLRIERSVSMMGADLKRYDFELTNAAFEIWKASRAALVVELPHDHDFNQMINALNEAGVTYK